MAKENLKTIFIENITPEVSQEDYKLECDKNGEVIESLYQIGSDRREYFTLYDEVIDIVDNILSENEEPQLTDKERNKIDDIDLVGETILIKRSYFTIVISTDDVNWLGIGVRNNG